MDLRYPELALDELTSYTSGNSYPFRFGRSR